MFSSLYFRIIFFNFIFFPLYLRGKKYVLVFLYMTNMWVPLTQWYHGMPRQPIYSGLEITSKISS